MESAFTPPRVAIPIPQTGRLRPVITDVRPRVESGSWPAKAALGDRVPVEADVLINGPDLVAADLSYMHESDQGWTTVPMHPIGNDRWRAELPVARVGMHRFAIRARPDTLETWRRDLATRLEAEQDVSTDLLIGATLLWDAAARATGHDRRALASAAEHVRAGVDGLDREVDVSALTASTGSTFRDGNGRGARDGTSTVRSVLFSDELGRLAARYPDPTTYVASPIYRLFADPERARFSAWYEVFPAPPRPTRLVRARLPT